MGFTFLELKCPPLPTLLIFKMKYAEVTSMDNYLGEGWVGMIPFIFVTSGKAI